MKTGTVVIEWDAMGHLTIKASFSLDASEGRKAAIEKLLDAARAINNRGTALELPNLSSTRILSAKG